MKNILVQCLIKKNNHQLLLSIVYLKQFELILKLKHKLKKQYEKYKDYNTFTSETLFKQREFLLNFKDIFYTQQLNDKSIDISLKDSYLQLKEIERLGNNKYINDKVIEEIIRDCFSGDYSYTVEDIKKELASDNKRFKLFLFSKILANSKYPSKFIRELFNIDEVRQFLSKIPERQVERESRRRQLVKANVLGEAIEIKGLKWQNR